MRSACFPKAALFDLDGTLLDSAPDMLAVANQLLRARQLPAIELPQIRPAVSKGSAAMIAASFPQLNQAEQTALIPEFLAVYRQLLGQYSHPFVGIEDVLHALEAKQVLWGIVTNKSEQLAQLNIPALGWQTRCAVLIAGDTTAHSKPHPLPLLTAAERININPAECVYVGDDKRDIQAARAAGMPSIAALWGYRPFEDEPSQWGADVICQHPEDLLDPANWPQRP